MFEFRNRDKVIHLLEEQIHLLERIAFSEIRIQDLLTKILNTLNPNRVLGGVMSEIGDPMALLPIAPGFNPGFTVTPTPTGVATLLAQSAWTSSDTVNAPVTAVATDATGLTATVSIPTTAVVGTAFTLTWTYTNADATTATVTGNFTIVAAPPTDVTGGTMAQTS